LGKKKSKQEEGNNKDQKGNRNPIKKKKKTEKINVTNSWFLEKIDVISKAPLRQRGDPNKIRHERRNKTDFTEIKTSWEQNYKQIYNKK